LSRADPYRSSKLGISSYHQLVRPKRWRATLRGSDRARVRRALECRIDEGPADEEDVMIYEIITDPEVRIAEKQQRSREGQYKRHVRRRANRAKDDPGH
jgi:hypothetical protein